MHRKDLFTSARRTATFDSVGIQHSLSTRSSLSPDPRGDVATFPPTARPKARSMLPPGATGAAPAAAAQLRPPPPPRAAGSCRLSGAAKSPPVILVFSSNFGALAELRDKCGAGRLPPPASSAWSCPATSSAAVPTLAHQRLPTEKNSNRKNEKKKKLSREK